MNTNRFSFSALLVALAVLLSVVNAEGQELTGKLLAEINGFITFISANGSWVVYGSSHPIFEGKELVASNPSHSIEIGGPRSGFITEDGLFVSNAQVGATEFFSIVSFNLKKLNGPVDFRGRTVYVQNWTLEAENLNGFGKFFHVDEQNNKLIVYSEDTIFVYEFLGDGTPLQEIYESDLVNFAGAGQGFAISNGTDIFLYQYKDSEYVLEAKYSWRKAYQNIDYENVFGEKMTMSMAEDGKILLVVSSLPVEETEYFSIDPGTFTSSRIVLREGNVRFADREYAVVSNNGHAQLMHIPTASLFAEVILPQRNVSSGWLGCVDMNGSILNVYILETIDSTSYISKYETATFPVSTQSQKVSAVTGKPVWRGGNFWVEGATRSMPGDFRIVGATAFPGFVIDSFFVNGIPVKAKGKAGHFKRVQINGPTVVTGAFRRATAVEKSRAVTLKFSAKYERYLAGSQTEKAITSATLLSGKYIFKSPRPGSGRDEYTITRRGKVSVKSGTY